MSQFDRSELVVLAELSYKNNLFNDAICHMKEAIKMSTPLGYDERECLLWSYNKLKEPFYDIFYSSKKSNLNKKLRGELQTKAQTAINRISDEFIELLDSYWVKRDESKDAVAHYKCFKAVQYDHKAYFASGEDKENLIIKALELYEEASKIANEHLSPAHPIRLIIAVWFSKFHYYLLNSVDKALAISKEAYEKCQPCLSELSEDLKSSAELYF